VKEFDELLLEISSMGEQDTLFCFLDGLCGWAKMELKRQGVQDLASAIVDAELLIEFKRNSSKGQGKKNGGSGKVGEIKTSPPRKTSPLRTMGKARRTTQLRSTHASYAMDLTGPSSVRRRESLPPRRRERSPPLSYLMPFRPRWRDDLAGACM